MSRIAIRLMTVALVVIGYPARARADMSPASDASVGGEADGGSDALVHAYPSCPIADAGPYGPTGDECPIAMIGESCQSIEGLITGICRAAKCTESGVTRECAACVPVGQDASVFDAALLPFAMPSPECSENTMGAVCDGGYCQQGQSFRFGTPSSCGAPTAPDGSYLDAGDVSIESQIYTCGPAFCGSFRVEDNQCPVADIGKTCQSPDSGAPGTCVAAHCADSNPTGKGCAACLPGGLYSQAVYSGGLIPLELDGPCSNEPLGGSCASGNGVCTAIDFTSCRVGGFSGRPLSYIAGCRVSLVEVNDFVDAMPSNRGHSVVDAAWSDSTDDGPSVFDTDATASGNAAGPSQTPASSTTGRTGGCAMSPGAGVQLPFDAFALGFIVLWRRRKSCPTPSGAHGIPTAAPANHEPARLLPMLTRSSTA